MMNKHLSVVYFSILGLALFCFGINFGINSFESWGGIVVGVIIIIVSIIIFQMGKTIPILYNISYCMNYFATGLSVSAFYNHVSQSSDLDIFIIASGMIFASIVLFYILSQISILKEAMPFIITFFIITTLVIDIVLWINEGGDLYQSLFFFLQIGYFHIIAFYIENSHSIHRNLTLFSFGLFAIVTYIVILILSEGEALEALAHGGIVGDGKKNQNQ